MRFLALRDGVRFLLVTGVAGSSTKAPYEVDVFKMVWVKALFGFISGILKDKMRTWDQIPAKSSNG